MFFPSKKINRRKSMACMKLLAFVFLAVSAGLNLDQIFLVQGRQFAQFSDLTKSRNNREENASYKARVLIGSRPPRCERMCQSCGHCEAVQVPISPSVKYLHHSKESHYNLSTSTTINAYSRGDDISNYKPMRWKCICGDFIVNP